MGLYPGQWWSANVGPIVCFWEGTFTDLGEAVSLFPNFVLRGQEGSSMSDGSSFEG